MLARVEFDGEERARLAYAQGKGVLFFTGHFGFWELQAMVHALRLAADGVLARALDNPQLNELLEQIRQRTGNTVIYRQGTIRRVMRMLQAGHGVARADRSAHPRAATRSTSTSSTGRRRRRRRSRRWRCAPARRSCRCSRCRSAGGRYRMIYEHPVEPPRADSERRRSASSRSAAPTCSRCTCAAIPSCGCGCTGAGATTGRRRTDAGMFPAARRIEGLCEDCSELRRACRQRLDSIDS